MNKINELIKTIKQSKFKNKDDYLLSLVDIINSFVEYSNSVINIEIYAQSVSEWNQVSSYMYKQKDEDRSIKYNICIDKCDKLNKIANDFNFDLYIDTSNRHKVACFVGDARKMIKKTEFEDNGYIAYIKKYIDPIDEIPMLNIDIKCKYEEFIPYPILKYNTITNKVEAEFNGFFKLQENNLDEWHKGIDNAYEFITKINKVIENILENEKDEITLE